MFPAVQEKYVSAAEIAMLEQSLEPNEVLSYLRSITDFKLGPMDAIRAQTEVIGDPCLPSPAQVATLEWLQSAYAIWTKSYPIEAPLAAELRKLLPACAALAITDANFFIPGAHPIHRVLDSIQEGAIGWQSELGRAGLGFEQMLGKAVTGTQAWLQGDGSDIDASCEKIVAAVNKDQARVQRMTQRLTETEVGQLRTASARWKSAEMINRSLEKYKATRKIGQFLHGPWYESAQLVLLKYGADSPEWAQMSTTTLALLESLQIDASASSEMRQQLFQLVSTIPDELKRWLLSLHMDPSSADDAVARIESTHRLLLKEQDIQLETIEPLHMDGMSADRTSGTQLETIEALKVGQWFSVEQPKGKRQRVQLILKLGQEQELRFSNKAGLKALVETYENFCSLLADGKARPLHQGSSFSLCLAVAAGVESEEDIAALTNDSTPGKARQNRAKAEEVEREEAEKTLQEKAAELLREQQLEEDQQRREEEKLRQETERQQQEKMAETALLEQQQAKKRLREQQLAEEVQLRQQQSEKTQREQLRAEAFLKEQQQADKALLEQQQAAAARTQQEIEPAAMQQPQQDPPSTEPCASYDDPETTRNALYELEINIPPDTRLKFIDGDTPLTAKMATHDTARGSYVFVNEEGQEVRSVSKQELIDLMENDLVEFL
ncbi:MAG: DUF1631 family protein [Halioglobus sp.]